MQSTELVTRLYQAVDSRTAASLEPFLSPSVTFQLGNNLPVSGKEAVLQVNASFFESVAAMAHTIDKVWSQDADVRDRAIIATYLFHALRRTELATLKVGSLQERRGVLHFKVAGKGSKIRFVPAHPAAVEAISAYLEVAEHGEDKKSALFRPVRNNRTGTLENGITGDGVYRMVKAYAAAAEIHVDGLCLHALRATAAPTPSSTPRTSHTSRSGWAHANIATTRLYDRRKSRPEDSPTFRVSY